MNKYSMIKSVLRKRHSNEHNLISTKTEFRETDRLLAFRLSVFYTSTQNPSQTDKVICEHDFADPILVVSGINFKGSRYDQISAQ